jgi:hypothetical protein
MDDSGAEGVDRRDRTNTRMTLLNGFPMLLLAFALGAVPSMARADDSLALGLTLKDHVFDPPELKAGAGKDIAITLKNEDDSFEEFDSDSLHTEKIVPGKGKVTIKLRPLAAGRYPFRGEFHDATAQGLLIVE